MIIKRISDSFVKKNKLRICHFSDNHGKLPTLYGRFDAVVCTGDFFPNTPMVLSGQKNLEMAFQLDWTRQNANAIKKWLRGTPMFICMGNHDFLHPDLFVGALMELGVNNITSLHDRVVEFEGCSFYGFPYVPAISGSWNYEREIPEMQVEVDKMVSVLNSTKVNVIAAHAPIHGTLDLSMGNARLGSSIIANALDFSIDKSHLPRYYLHGHIHEANGIAFRNGMVVSNAATTQQIIEVDL